MAEPYRILVVDDQSMSRKLLTDLLTANDYVVTEASGGREALQKIHDEPPDLVLLDVLMPDLNGYEVCTAIREQPAGEVLPIVMVTALDQTKERVRGLEAGADDFLSKPINRPELIARVKSLLRIKSLYDVVQSQADELAELNTGLARRVQEQIEQLGRLTQLKRFFPPQLAEQIVSGDLNDPMQTRRREVTVVVLGLRGFNAFADTSEPEEVMRLLRSFHAEMGTMIEAHGGTLEQFTGSSMIVILNDPVVVEDPARHAVLMALEMQQRFEDFLSDWRKRGYDFGLGIGISHGFATIGAIGDEERASYGVIGRVTNVASGLCEEAAAGEILISTPVKALTEESVNVEEVEQINMTEFARTVSVYRVTGMRAETDVAPECEWPLRIHALGRFAVEVNGQPLQFSRKVQKKPLDMLRVLVAYGRVRIEASTIIEHLWPDAEGDSGKTSFDSNLHRLRKLLDVNDVLPMSEGKLSLDQSRCWIDVVALDDVVSRVERDANTTDGNLDQTAVALMKELLQLYAGHFLDSESEEAWAVAARDRLKAKFIRAVSLIGSALEARQDWEQAAALYSRVLELDNLAEALYRRLMNCYIELGEPAEALNSYRRCRDMLSVVLGIEPSPETEAIRATLGQA
jgi:adenylate cyclase